MSFAVTGLDDLEPGANVLVLGSSAEGLRAVGLRLLVSDGGEQALLIETATDLEAVVEEYGRMAGEKALGTLSVIDCTGREDLPPGIDSELATVIDSPSSLTDLGMAFVAYGDKHADATESRVLFDAVSDLFDHLDDERIFEFVEAFVGRIHASGHVGIWLLDSDRAGEHAVSPLRELFEEVIEVREGSASTETRVGGDEDWTPLDG